MNLSFIFSIYCEKLPLINQLFKIENTWCKHDYVNTLKKTMFILDNYARDNNNFIIGRFSTHPLTLTHIQIYKCTHFIFVRLDVCRISINTRTNTMCNYCIYRSNRLNE